MACHPSPGSSASTSDPAPAARRAPWRDSHSGTFVPLFASSAGARLDAPHRLGQRQQRLRQGRMAERSAGEQQDEATMHRHLLDPCT